VVAGEGGPAEGVLAAVLFGSLLKPLGQIAAHVYSSIVKNNGTISLLLPFGRMIDFPLLHIKYSSYRKRRLPVAHNIKLR